ncbi:hypothetical protein [Sphingomonas phyllosphaerae]|uniref:hypothetical protein n=1 Tax=Sphingomonas phyllosphaerae TaxID=257003 RepID=UPI0012DD4548|nr:hypothetical protein [Sphingomonas phyllosphaerae]
MAKKSKAKAGKLPKEVLGVKVPKELRKAGEKLIEQAQGPAGRQAIAGALTAVVGAVATAALSREAARAAAPRTDEPVREQAAGGTPKADPGEAFARAAEALVGKFFAPRS